MNIHICANAMSERAESRGFGDILKTDGAYMRDTAQCIRVYGGSQPIRTNKKRRRRVTVYGVFSYFDHSMLRISFPCDS